MHSSNSPFILKYTDASYSELRIIDRTNSKSLKAFITGQPEWNDDSFIRQITPLINEKKVNNSLTIMDFIYKYRIQKYLSNESNFEKRKELLINSEWWKNAKAKKHISIKENEVIDENALQSAINSITIHLAHTDIMRFEGPKLNYGLSGGYCEMVLDDGYIKYPDVALD